MKKFVCTVCGYVYEGEAAPAECPVCHAPAEKFKEQTGDREWAVSYTHLDVYKRQVYFCMNGRAIYATLPSVFKIT